MKKRLLSLLLTVCLVAALFTGLTGTANAADDKVVGYLTSYTLKAGDSIYGVCEAKKIDFSANLAMIGKINGITNYNYMMPGKVLWLPTKTATTSESYYSLLSHTLVAGETPAALCQSYGIDYNANYKLLAALNNNLNVFMAGQQFILPLYVTPAGAATPTPAPTSGTSAAPTATPKPGTTPAPTANVPTGDTVSYYLAQHTLASTARTRFRRLRRARRGLLLERCDDPQDQQHHQLQLYDARKGHPHPDENGPGFRFLLQDHGAQDRLR